jgi:hypothetical protein
MDQHTEQEVLRDQIQASQINLSMTKARIVYGHKCIEWLTREIDQTTNFCQELKDMVKAECPDDFGRVHRVIDGMVDGTIQNKLQGLRAAVQHLERDIADANRIVRTCQVAIDAFNARLNNIS